MANSKMKVGVGKGPYDLGMWNDIGNPDSFLKKKSSFYLSPFATEKISLIKRELKIIEMWYLIVQMKTFCALITTQNPPDLFDVLFWTT